MAQFSRRTILAATDLMANWGHTNIDIDRFLLEYALEETVRGNSMASRANALARYLIAYPNTLSDDGLNLTDTIVGELINGALQASVDGYPRTFSFDVFRERYPALHRGLERDGFRLEFGLAPRTDRWSLNSLFSGCSEPLLTFGFQDVFQPCPLSKQDGRATDQNSSFSPSCTDRGPLLWPVTVPNAPDSTLLFGAENTGVLLRLKASALN
jgi:hypothetical protein